MVSVVHFVFVFSPPPHFMLCMTTIFQGIRTEAAVVLEIEIFYLEGPVSICKYEAAEEPPPPRFSSYQERVDI